MKYALKAAAGLAALSFVLAGCASAPSASPRLLAAEASLQQAKANPTTFEAGRAPLEKAEVALHNARESYMKGKDDDYIHSVRMGEGYVSLAESRGNQVEANHKIASLNTERADVVSQARARQLNTAEAATVAALAATAKAEAATASAEARATQSEKVAAVAVADSASADAARMAAEARTAELQASLSSYEQKKTDLGVTLILRDLQFASASSILSSGAQSRLAPLASFLAKQPDTKIQIVGHTDSQGTSEFNMDLSTRRAASVGAYLNSTGVNMSRITSIGMGETMPTGTNETAAGRAINRRVEVTILN